MAAKINKMLFEKCRVVIAVGVLHLTGPENIRSLLEKSGFIVSRVSSNGKSPNCTQPLALFKWRNLPNLANFDWRLTLNLWLSERVS